MKQEPHGIAVEAARDHLDATVRTWLGIGPDGGVELPPLPEPLARALLRVEELEHGHRDQWGCWEHAFSDAYRRGALWVPEVDRWVAERRRELAGSVAMEPAWPNAAPFAVCLTHDVDMVSRRASPAQALRVVRAAPAALPTGAGGVPDRVLRTGRAVARAGWYGLARAPSTSATLERCLDVEAEYGVTSSWFFTVHPSRPTPYDCLYRLDDPCLFRGERVTIGEVARRIADEGFDVGLHGSYRSALDARLLAEERAALESAIGRRVVTTRQHYLHFEVGRTPRVQQEAGLLADTTLGFNRNVGFRAGTSMPFRLFDFAAGAPLDVLEVPLIVQESPLLSAAALELDVELARRVIEQLADAVADAGGVATLLFHPHSLLDPDFLALYRFSIEHCLARGAWFASLDQISEWWRSRERRAAAAVAPSLS